MESPAHPGDSQKVELLGRNRLIDELLRDDLEVALPVRDRGIDLIAYADLGATLRAYSSRPIQMKAAWTRTFSIDRKYEKFPDLIIAYVWNLCDAQQARTYAMTFAESYAVAEAMGWTRTTSWQRGYYANNQPGKKIMALLEPYRMSAGAWWKLVVETKNAPA
jgi:hypothetical protein